MPELITTQFVSDANILAYYRFNTGALTTDSSGASRTLTNNNTVGETEGGKYGFAADYTSGNTDKTFSRAEDIWANGAISFVSWFKTYDNTQNNGLCLLPTSSTNRYLYAGVNNGTISFSCERVGVGVDTVSGIVAMDNNWHHYGVSVAGSAGDMILYHNGIPIGTQAITAGTGTVGQGNTLNLGRSDGQFMKGFMDDTAFFSRALTAGEMAIIATDSGMLDLTSKMW